MIARRLLCAVVALLLPLQSFAAVNRSDPARMLELVDQYLAELKVQPTGNKDLFNAGQQAYLANAVSAQINTLEPEDYNVFLFYLMDRYIKNPDERKDLFTFVKALHDSNASEWARYKQIDDGPAHFVVDGVFAYGTWILLGGIVGWRVVMHTPARNTALVQSMQRLELSMATKPKPYRYTYKVLSSPFTTSALAGGIVGGLEYIREKSKARRLDPLPVLNVVQSQLACLVSYQGLELADRFEAVRNDSEALVREFQGLDAAITQTHKEASLLVEQYPSLDNLDVTDRLFQQKLAQLPQAKNWQEFRKNLIEAEQSADGQCRQMSLTHLKIQLEELRRNLVLFYEIFAPPAPETQDRKP